MATNKTRLDVLLVERQLVESREKGRRQIMAGEVQVNGQLVDKPGAKVPNDAALVMKTKPQFVSRGGDKLAGAIARFPLAIAGAVCADVGASTGGFTDALLQHGAKRVYAIDVGKGILHWQLRTDPRVVVMEETNARYLETLPETVSLITADASFISLRLLLPVMQHWLGADGEIVALIKPQFEVGPAQVGKKGVVRDPALHRQAVEDILVFAGNLGLYPTHLARSPLKGPAGNVEFLARLAVQGPASNNIDLLRGIGLAR